MRNENRNNDFCKDLLTVHKASICNYTAVSNADDLFLQEGLRVNISENAGEVVTTAAFDFVDFLFTSMNLPAEAKYKAKM